MNRLDEVMRRIGSRPALICMAHVSDYFGDSVPYKIDGGIAIIDIRGPLLNEEWEGCTSYGSIQNQIKIASADPAVKGILLNINSPGGTTDNAFETAALIAGVEKPCYSAAASMAYSGAFLFAVSTKKIFCLPTTGGVGSVGVYCSHMDVSQMLKKIGVDITLISAGDGKTDGNPYGPLSDSAREKWQTEVDRLYGEFVGAVASGRKMTTDAIVKLGAGCFEGAKNAIAAGYADAPGDLADAWAALVQDIEDDDDEQDWPLMSGGKSSAASAARQQEAINMAEVSKPAEVTPTPADIEKIVAGARTEGYADATAIVDLCVIAGATARIAGFITDKKTAKQVSEILLAERVAGQAKTQLNTAVMPGVDAGAGESAAFGKARPWSEILKAQGLYKGDK